MTRASLAVAAFTVTFATASCSRSEPSPEPKPHVGWGTVMADVGRRFELLGRAGTAGRFELAEYERGEIEESFETLGDAEPPKEGHPEVLAGLATTFTKTTLPELERALATHDRAQIDAAFARTATACNGCHQASGHGFIEVPTVAGHAVPSTDSIP